MSAAESDARESDLRQRVLAASRALADRAPAWLAHAREEAAAVFSERGLPGPRDEDWRFTPLVRLEQEPWDLSPAPQITVSRAALPAWLQDAHVLVLVDGAFAPSLSSPGPGPAGTTVRSLAKALEDADAPPAGLLSLADAKARTPTALATALARDGAVIEVEAGASVSVPLYILHVQTSAAAGRIVCSRSAIHVGAGASVQIVEHYLAASAVDTAATDGPATEAVARGSLTSTVTELSLGRDARASHVIVQERAGADVHLAELCAHQDAGSQLASYSIALGARVSRTDIRATLAGAGSHAELRGLYLAQGERHIDHLTTIDHASPDTTSRETYKGIAGARGRGIFCGRVHVRPDAQRIDAAQTSRGLLLDDQGTLHARPQLEIYADDVKCSHGATIGALSDDALFYLRARGVGAAEARAMLIRAFASEVVSDLPHAALREHIDAELSLRLGGGPR